jgi:hypothetical protein
MKRHEAGEDCMRISIIYTYPNLFMMISHVIRDGRGTEHTLRRKCIKHWLESFELKRLLGKPEDIWRRWENNIKTTDIKILSHKIRQAHVTFRKYCRTPTGSDDSRIFAFTVLWREATGVPSSNVADGMDVSLTAVCCTRGFCYLLSRRSAIKRSLSILGSYSRDWWNSGNRRGGGGYIYWNQKLKD